MNAYYQENERINSNKRTIRTNIARSSTASLPMRRGLLETLSLLLATLPCARMLQLLRVLGVALALVGCVGIVGAVECGSLTMGSASLLAALCIGIEFLCLRGSKKASRKQ